MIDFLLDRSDLPLSRRAWLSIGSVAGTAALLPKRISAEAASATLPGFGRAKSVIVVFAGGGQSQIDTWDPKPHAPAQIRGEFSPIETAVPGTWVCEHLPRVARVADRLTIVRSMSHEDLDHGSASYLTLTGHYHKRRSGNPPPSPNDHPFYGSIFKRLRPNAGFAEPAIQLNGPMLVPQIVGPGQNAGFLGREFDPLTVGDVTEGAVAIPGLTGLKSVPQIRLEQRQSLLSQLDRETELLQDSIKTQHHGELYRRAFEMLARPEARNAFDLSAEKNSLRRRYGLNRSGQACLLARRLVEAGVPLTTVFFNESVRGQDTMPDQTDAYGWDTHNDIFSALKNHLLPRFDLAFSALIEDLEHRGLLDETLVLCLGEFGRAPKIALEKNFVGSSPGRKHWAAVYSIVAAGAGVLPGKILGASNRVGAYPASEMYSPADLIATLFAALGIDPSGHYVDATGRPFPIAPGVPIAGLYGD